MLGFKVAKHGDIPVLLTLEIPGDAVTNSGRSNIVRKDTAYYRTNKAKVLKIEDAKGVWYDTATSIGRNPFCLTFTAGDVTEEPVTHAEGIRYSLSRDIAETDCLQRTATAFAFSPYSKANTRHRAGIFWCFTPEAIELFGLQKISNGTVEEWHENGQKKTESNNLNGVPHGPSRTWFENGQIASESHFNNGEYEGISYHWYENGQKEYEYIYVNKTLNACRKWDEKGKLVYTWSKD